MSPIEQEIVRRKLERITENLRLLEPFRGLSPDAYAADVYRRKAIERLLQEIVEAAVDLNSHVLVGEGRPAPDDLFTSFLALAELGVLPPAFAAAIAPSAGLRNRLVHEYDAIDDARVLEAVGSALNQYPQYVGHVERFLQGGGAGEAGGDPR